MINIVVREWIEEALDLLEQPGLEYTNRERREKAIEEGYNILKKENVDGVEGSESE